MARLERFAAVSSSSRRRVATRECLVSGKTEADVSISIYLFQFTYNAYQHVMYTYLFVWFLIDVRFINLTDVHAVRDIHNHYPGM